MLSQISNNCHNYLTRATCDQGSFKEVHLNHQKEFWHETNFHRSPDQSFITEAWNYKKIFVDEEVMNFTNWTFPSPSVCEYRHLEEKFSQTKKRPSSTMPRAVGIGSYRPGPNSIMDLKRDLFVDPTSQESGEKAQ
uniref:Uncharacterized protein n=1 Tax=Brassica campestris TaxID=3711 RepID=A0A3P5YND5_BRACM|nr:unnamed protein product [Brassica rapa]